MSKFQSSGVNMHEDYFKTKLSSCMTCCFMYSLNKIIKISTIVRIMNSKSLISGELEMKHVFVIKN